jgi:hypothetical protein
VIEALKQAVAVGEIDIKMTATGEEVGLRFKKMKK